jgi:hypothetical protein
MKRKLTTTSWLFVSIIMPTRADTMSYSGTLTSPEDSTSGQITITLTDPGVVELQTWGFGGGTNAAGDVIPTGGFDPFLGVFAGTGSSATFINGTSDILSNYGSFMGCPPAGQVDIGGSVCGDINMSLSLAAGNYTILLTDADYYPVAVDETDGQLGDGFFDLTSGAFQTCNGLDCVTDSANWALDITTPSGAATVPEPAALPVAGVALLASAAAYRRRRISFQQAPPFSASSKSLQEQNQ